MFIKDIIIFVCLTCQFTVNVSFPPAPSSGLLSPGILSLSRPRPNLIMSPIVAELGRRGERRPFLVRFREARFPGLEGLDSFAEGLFKTLLILQPRVSTWVP